jgi:hypothetical protein
MSSHKYACGQHVTFNDRRFLGPSWSGGFIITKLLPMDDAMPRYQIKSTGETHSRVAEESQLKAAFTIFRG